MDTQPFGVSNCIIFRPDNSATCNAGDVYTVLVTGLKRSDGGAATLSYSVEFFDLY